MFKHIEKWNEPADILEKLPKHGDCEMTSAQHGFLCGLLREKKPYKVLEVGVASGGTSCVILEALERICTENDMEVTLHSVDIDERFYRDKQYPVGYMVDIIRERFPHVCHARHYGAMLPYFINEIGGEIDFLILDTSHVLPGELLDFLLVLPFLKKDAIVVLHDTILSLRIDSPMSFATSVLLESVYAEKFLLYEDECPGGVDNIGAFSVIPETNTYVANVFMALMKRWGHKLTDEQINMYRCNFIRHYDRECMYLFNASITLNRKADYRDKLKGCYTDVKELDYVLRHWKNATEKIVIYGIGDYGKAFIRYAQVASFRVDALAVTDGEPLHEVKGCDLPIYELSNLPYVPDECTVIIAVQAQNVRRIIEKELRYRGYFRIL